MTRLITKYFWVLNLLFVGAAVWLLVYLCLAVFQDQLTFMPKSAASAKRGASPAVEAKSKDYKDYAVIPDRNIFNPGEKGLKLLPLGARGRAEAGIPGDGPKAMASGGYRLIGTITGPGDSSSAILQDGSGKQALYRIHSDLGGAKIVRISRREVVIHRDGGEDEVLSLAETKSKLSFTPATTSAAAGDVVKKLAPNRFVVNREDVTKAVGNVNQFMTQARIKPFLQAGRPSGFTIGEITPGSLIDKLGVRNNDVIKKVNGQPINKPEEIFQAYSQLQRDGNIEIEIDRSGRAEVLRYEIR